MNTHQPSKIRNREDALAIILPKFLGIMWRAYSGAQGVPLPGDNRLRVGQWVVEIDQDLVLGGSKSGLGYLIHVYVRDSSWTKVFSAQLGDRSVTDGSFNY